MKYSLINNMGNVNLVPVKWEHMEYIRWLWSDVDTMDSVGGPIYISNAQAMRWYKKVIEPGNLSDFYRLIENMDRQFVGEVSYHRLNFENMTAEFNIKIAYLHRGKGYGREAMNLFFRYFFNDLGGRMMIDNLALNNDVGKNTLLKFGFIQVAEEKEYYKLQLSRERFNELYTR